VKSLGKTGNCSNWTGYTSYRSLPLR
jgi:hypothetical protein